MSTEDTLARADALTYADVHAPMALEEVPCAVCKGNHPTIGSGPGTVPAFACPGTPRRRGRLTEEEKARRAAERAAAQAERALERERKKAETAERKRLQILADKQAKLDAAEGGRIALPAVVLRDGTVKSVDMATTVEIIEQYLEDLCLDCETSGYWIGHQYYELRTVQLGGEEMAVVLDAADEMQMEIARWALAAALRIWAHSTPADGCPVVKHGLIAWDDLWAKLYDSVIRAKLVDPVLCGSEADKLKDLARDLLGGYAVSPAAEVAKDELFKAMGTQKNTDVLTPPEKNGWYAVSKFAVTMIRYAGSDVLDLAAVLRVLPPLPVPQAVLERERQAQAICARAAFDGFPLDLPHIQVKIAEFKSRQEVAQAKVELLSDGRLTNPSASKEVLEYLVAKGYPLKVNRKTKKVTAGKESLEPIAKRGDELAKYIVEFRHCVTTRGLLLAPLENLCTHGDAIMRPTVYTINAKTGRMSCVRPNGQQFSRQGGIRACVKCWLRYLGISADFSGCEILVAAALSGDKGLYEAETSPYCHRCHAPTFVDNPCDCGTKMDNGRLVVAGHTGLHWLTAHTAKGDGAVKEDRYNAKRGTFTRLFGGGPRTAADQVGTEVYVMEEMFEAFSAVAPAFTAWDNWLRDCYDQGARVWRDYETGTNYMQDIPGSRHLVYQTYSGRNVYVTNGAHAAGNGAIQGTARELLVDGLLEWQHTKWGNCAVLPVHDQIIGFVPDDEATDATAELARCMETDILSSPGFPVHIGVDTDQPFVNWPDSS